MALTLSGIAQACKAENYCALTFRIRLAYLGNTGVSSGAAEIAMAIIGEELFYPKLTTGRLFKITGNSRQ
jgi:hypothetical protein